MEENQVQTIVVAEDDPANRKILCHYIRMYGFEVAEHEDGALAFDYLKDNLSKVSLVVSDLMMPNMDGLDLLKELRGLGEEAADIPFIFLSAVLDGDQVTEAMELGIKDYLLKPVTKDKVEEKLKEVFPDQEIAMKKKKSS